MPELPEVEEVRRTLEPFIIGRRTRAITVHRRDILTPPRADLAPLAGRAFKRTLRHGKKLFLEFDDSQTLLFHLGMSGRIDCIPSSAPLAPHTHFIIHLQNAGDVRFRDPRRFGGVWYYPRLQTALDTQVKNKLGVDALECRPADFAHWKQAAGRLKTRLLAQRDIAGLGNIYVDEALWQSRLHPLQIVSRIPPIDIEKLVAAIHDVLARSLASGGTTLRDYRNVSDQPGAFALQLRAYGRAGEACFRCQTPLAAITAAGRTTVFCPKCQRRR